MASYLMKKNNMNFEEVYELLKEKAPDAEPNEGFMGQLCEYAEKIEEEAIDKAEVDLLEDSPSEVLESKDA